STAANPVISYQQPGSYDVTLIATNSNGCTDTLTKKRFVNIGRPKVLLNNTPQQGCVPYSYQPAISILTGDVISSYAWDFGDGQTSTAANPTNIYSSAGTYTVKLIYTTAGGCTDSTIVPAAVHVGVPPVPALDASPRISCAFQPVQFTDLSTGAIDNWLWEFGDGATSSSKNPAHRYTDTGYFTIILTVYSNGCKTQIVVPNFVYIKPPIARFTHLSDCSDHFTHRFTDQSIGALSWSWDFGDGNTSAVRNPSHTYAAAGSYTVMLTVRNDTCEHTVAQTVRIIDEKAGFAANDSVVCKNSVVTFTGKAFNTQNIVLYNWDFGDGVNVYSGNTVSHKYTQSGKYNTRLTITDLNGCNDVLIKPQYIEVDGPTARFGVSVPAVCTLTPIVFTDASTPD
ncbi:MAG TPA: PKD domain-containing protein, partial [Chitinophagaceae bacterium]|nr:PKD domain-containing protein [Chitinophagaceae bacterium]